MPNINILRKKDINLCTIKEEILVGKILGGRYG
jgi:hypothetical protein